MLGKLRLVRLLLEGGAQVNERSPRGETPLLAACKALRGEPTGPGTVKLLSYLLQNQADPNAQDRMGRTPLMYACMERAGAQVASTLLSAGADPSMEDYSGASALVYAINAQKQATLKVLVDSCHASGRDIIIIATEMGVSGGPVTRQYLNVPPSPNTSPNTSPVSCMSPSDIILKTGSPNSAESENIFNFRGTGKRGSTSMFSAEPSPEERPGALQPRQRMLSEPWLAIHNLARLNKAYEEGQRERSVLEEGDVGQEGGGDDGEKGIEEEWRKYVHPHREGRRESRVKEGERDGGQNLHKHLKDRSSGASRPLFSPTKECQTQAAEGKLTPERKLNPGALTSDKAHSWKSSVDKLPPCPSSRSHGRRNTLPSLTVIPPTLHLPPLIHQASWTSDSHLQIPAPVAPRRGLTHPAHPPSPCTRPPPRPSFLPPLPLTTPCFAPPLPLSGERGRRSPRRHSVQLEQ
ncbi:ankyrin repeat domain-containing protein 34A isoform X2 [Osmerus eperlanus]